METSKDSEYIQLFKEIYFPNTDNFDTNETDGNNKSFDKIRKDDENKDETKVYKNSIFNTKMKD